MPKNKALLPKLQRVNTNDVVYPSEALKALVALCRHASENRSRHVAMCWPAPLSDSSLIHSLSTMQNQTNGDKFGIRSILFPTKSNIFHPLNQLSWDTKDILEMIRRNYEPNEGVNTWVTNSHRDKDPFLFSVTALERIDDETIHPTLTDLMPHFYSGSKYSGWTDCSEHLLGSILARTRRRRITEAFRKSADEVMGKPSSAPDAVFAIDGRLTELEIKHSMSELYSYEILPDLLLINWSLKTRIEYPNWRSITKKLIRTIDSIAGEQGPGLVIIIDDPSAALKLQNDFSNMPDESGSKALKLHATVNKSGGQSLLNKCSLMDKPQPRTFDLQLIDSNSDRLCKDIYRVAKKNGLDKPSDNPLAEVISLVSRISSLPCGLRDIEEQFHAGEISERSVRYYRWLDLKSMVQEQLKLTPLRIDSSLLNESFEKVSALMGQAYEATSFALQLATLASQASVSNEIILVFETEFRRKMARTFLSRYGDYPNQLCFEDISSHLKFIMLKDLEHELTLQPSAHVVFVGLNTEVTRTIMCSNDIPKETTILSTHRAAMFLRATLISLENFGSTFDSFKTRILSLIQQTPSCNEVIPLFPQLNFKMPDHRIELTDDLFTDHDLVNHPDAWEIKLDDNRALHRLPEQRVFVYDPYCSDSSEQGFKEKQVRNLLVGEHLFVLSVELKLELDELLRKHGINLSADNGIFEENLRNYHSRIQELLDEKYPNLKRTEQVSALRSQILEKYPQYIEHFPQAAAMRYWINLENHLERNIEEIRPFAPAREVYFKAFALTLGMHEVEAASFWSRVIQPFRLARRVGGKKLSSGYATLFLEPEQLMSLGKITRHEIKSLTNHAREHTFAVKEIQKGQIKND